MRMGNCEPVVEYLKNLRDHGTCAIEINSMIELLEEISYDDGQVENAINLSMRKIMQDVINGDIPVSGLDDNNKENLN